MLTVSQLSKSFVGRALFDDVSLQANPFADCNASTQDIARLIEESFRLAAGNSRRYGCQAMSSLLVIDPAKDNRIIQILSAINYRFLGPNSR
jgi:hypothetical protein